MDSNDFRDKLNEATERTRYHLKRAERAASAVDEYSHKEPWVVAGVLAAFAAILGYILGRISGSGRNR